jgi:glutathione synthase/RimK-type ligase-like ATP-grasp enzyme
METSVSSEGFTGRISINGVATSLDHVASAYIRPYPLPDLLTPNDTPLGLAHANAIEEALWTWADLGAGLVVNRPDAMGSNCSKPFQCSLINNVGLQTPETLITSNPDDALDFMSKFERIIFKSISSTRSIVSVLDETRASELHKLARCPTQFQEYVEGADWRVHVLRDDVFACRIVSQADDYRYAERRGLRVDLVAERLDDKVASLCVDVTKELGLTISGIDLRQTPAGQWYCFEVNPSPAFTFFESATGLPISDALVDLLLYT